MIWRALNTIFAQQRLCSLRDSFFICTQSIVAIKIFRPDLKKSDSQGDKKLDFPV